MQTTDVVIIGAGPVGLFAAFQAGMLGMRCHIIDALELPGGQCYALYPEKPIYDIPGYPKILAADLIKQLVDQAAPFNPVYHLNQRATELITTDNSFVIKTSEELTIQATVIIIAAGAGAFDFNKPPLAGIESFENKSVFYFIKNRNDFINKKIIIAGGGDSAVDWAISLAEIANQVYLLHRRDKFRAAPESLRQIKQLADAGKITIITGYQLDRLIGSDGYLEAVVVKDLDGNLKTIEAEILCPFFGLLQTLGPIAEWELQLKSHHIAVTSPHCMTNINGIYAIGDIATFPGKLKLILTGFSDAAQAVHHAYARVFDGKALHFEYSTTKGLPR